MKPITPGFQPDERSINNLKKWISLDIREVREFIAWELPHMITYFMDTKGKKKSWQMTCQRWMRTAWTGKAGRDWEYDRHRRKWYNPKIAVTLPTASISIITPEQSIENFHRLEDKLK